MKNRASIFAVFLAVLLCCTAGSESIPLVEGKAPGTVGSMPILWFPVGEELVYRLYWGVIPVGLSRITSEWVEQDGRRRILIRYRVRTNRIFQTVYPMDDLAETLIDPDGFRPLTFRVKTTRRRQSSDETTVFDYRHLKALWSSAGSAKGKEYDIKPDTRDIVSFLFLKRQQGFPPDTNLTFRVAADDRLFDIGIKTKDFRNIDLPVFGKVKSLEMYPEVNFKGLMMEGGKLRMWVSEDPRHLCTRLEVRGTIANVKAILSLVKGPGDDFWTRKMHEEREVEEEPVEPAKGTETDELPEETINSPAP